MRLPLPSQLCEVASEERQLFRVSVPPLFQKSGPLPMAMTFSPVTTEVPEIWSPSPTLPIARLRKRVTFAITTPVPFTSIPSWP